MAIRTAFGAALVVTFIGGAALLLAGFFGRIEVDLPGILELRSGSAGAFEAELWFNPLAPLVLLVVLSLAIWSVGRAVRS